MSQFQIINFFLIVPKNPQFRVGKYTRELHHIYMNDKAIQYHEKKIKRQGSDIIERVQHRHLSS